MKFLAAEIWLVFGRFLAGGAGPSDSFAALAGVKVDKIADSIAYLAGDIIARQKWTVIRGQQFVEALLVGAFGQYILDEIRENTEYVESVVGM